MNIFRYREKVRELPQLLWVPRAFAGVGVGVGVRALRMGGCACFVWLRPSARVSRPWARFFAMLRPVIRRSSCAARRIGGCASAVVLLQFGVSMATAVRRAQRPHDTTQTRTER